MHLHRWLWGGLLALNLISAVAHAATADDAFAMGAAAFEEGKFAEARQYFERARSAGMESAALYYNLGATLYKLGLYPEAQSAFAACARDPAWAALARYNMGLAALQQGDQEAAAGYFTRAWYLADNDKLAALAQTMLERVRPGARRIPKSTIAVGLGYDSNVVLSDQALASPATGKSDVYVETLATTGANLMKGDDAPRWQASVYDIRYLELSDYNVTALQMGLDVPWQQGARFWTVGAQGNYLWRNGSAFQDIGTFKLAVAHDSGLNRFWRIVLQYDQINTLDPDFRFLEGRRVTLDVSHAQPLHDGRMYWGVVFEHNNREDDTIGADFYSYSPDRAGIWWRGSWLLQGRWKVEPTLRYRYSRYADEDRHGGVSKTRQDNDWQAGMVARYRLTEWWQLTGEYSFTVNRSNFSEFSYTRHQIVVGVARPLLW